MKIIHVITTPDSLGFTSGQAAFMRSAGVELQFACSPGAALDAFGASERVTTHAIRMTRAISPLKDLVSLVRLLVLFYREKPDLVHAHTPKASLIGMLAASLAGVRFRIFEIHGLPHSTTTGLTRMLLKLSTRIPCLLSTRTLCVSDSCADLAVSEKLCHPNKLKVLGHGSSNGVNAAKFCPDPAMSLNSRSRFGLDPKDLVIGFAGRLVRDKGVAELYRAWLVIREEIPNARLVVAGYPEQRDALAPAVLEGLAADSRVRMLGRCDDMPAFYSALDVFVLPTYREGLPTVILESAAMGVPTVASRCTGCVDAVVDGVTGLLIPTGDWIALADSIRHYLSNAGLRRQHGTAARMRALRDFHPQDIWKLTLVEYLSAESTPLSKNTRTTDPKSSAPAGGRASSFVEWRRAAGRCVLSKSWLTLFVKRALDICFSATALALLSPILLLLAISTWLSMGAPILFRQVRPGLHERPFQMVKFRTMRDHCDAAGNALPDSERLTAFGAFLRRTSLDELPELWNVLKGDMSLVGPRPLLPQYLDRYTEQQRRRHEVKPGVTGWAQVHGRNAVSWETRFQLDVWYVDNWSLALDLKILLRTFFTLFRREGISAPGHATMPEFMGTLES